MEEVAMMQGRIMLVCAFGNDLSEVEIDFYEKGQVKRIDITNALR